MAFESLSEKLNAAFKKLRGKGRLTQADIKEAMREVRMALLEADVSYKVVKDFTKTVTERASGAEVLEALSPAQMVIKIVNEELCRLMGSENQKLNFGSKSPAVVMLVGLQGAGRPRTARSSRGTSAGRASARCSPRAIFTVPPLSSSWRPSAHSSIYPSFRWGRQTPSISPRPPLSMPSATATTLCSSILQDVST